MAKYYHATDYSNLESILDEGLRASNMEHGVFLCTSPQEAMRFLIVRGYKEILVVEVEVPEEKMLRSHLTITISSLSVKHTYIKDLFQLKILLNSRNIIFIRRVYKCLRTYL